MRNIIVKIQPFTKAVSAFIALCIPVAAAVITATADGVITGTEWITIVSAAGALIGGTASVYQFPNIPQSGKQ